MFIFLKCIFFLYIFAFPVERCNRPHSTRIACPKKRAHAAFTWCGPLQGCASLKTVCIN